MVDEGHNQDKRLRLVPDVVESEEEYSHIRGVETNARPVAEVIDFTLEKVKRTAPVIEMQSADERMMHNHSLFKQKLTELLPGCNGFLEIEDTDKMAVFIKYQMYLDELISQIEGESLDDVPMMMDAKRFVNKYAMKESLYDQKISELKRLRRIAKMFQRILAKKSSN
ncbi:hypothetical protein GF340_00470 [Candidatus Peregrinibacteria bacterium]|nr:hypothetical protein [Candidatus Peregrinibacteria bacterium]